MAGPAIAQETFPDAPSAQKVKTRNALADNGWPRTFSSGADTFTIYQPQVDKWEGNLIDLYSAVELKSGKNSPAKYGVVWLQARTEVDKINRVVTLDQAKVTRVKFPAAPDKEPALNAVLEKKLPGATKTISLDRLQAEIDTDGRAIETIRVNNTPPRVILCTKPSLLIMIDGPPEFRPVQGTNLQRVMNTSAIVLLESDKGNYYLRVQDWWLQAKELEGPWTYAKKLPGDMKKAEEFAVSQAHGQPLTTAGTVSNASLKEAGNKADIPVVHVVFGPAELIETKGEPSYKTIPNTGLEYIENTTGNVFRLGSEYYILISGRWFKGASLGGDWAFVGENDFPPNFANIPTDSPKATVLASVPGTPQSNEALIANSIPQTATITRAEAKLTVQYDGEPIFAPVEGTSMAYAKNTSAAVLKVGDSYYCVEAGVWFVAPSPQGPWRVADRIPSEIYDIPASSRLHYVTYVKVYNSTPEVVHVGYTPGYYGTVVSADTKTVVFGTGWYYPPYISPSAWYGSPYTYGVGAGFAYSNEFGWSFGYGYGCAYAPWYYPCYYPWWGPMAYYGWGWYPYYGWAERQLPTSMASGATLLTRAQGPLGQIRTLETMAQRHAVHTTTFRPAGPQSGGAATTPTSTPATQQAFAAARPTTRIPA
jgi:hypothetical protein